MLQTPLMRILSLDWDQGGCDSGSVRAFDCLGDPVRRRILGMRRDTAQAASEVGIVVHDEYRISPSGVSRSPRPSAPGM